MRPGEIADRNQTLLLLFSLFARQEEHLAVIKDLITKSRSTTIMVQEVSLSLSLGKVKRPFLFLEISTSTAHSCMEDACICFIISSRNLTTDIFQNFFAINASATIAITMWKQWLSQRRLALSNSKDAVASNKHTSLLVDPK